MKKTIGIVFAVMLMLFSSFVSAGDYIIRHGGNDLLIVDTGGKLNVTTGKIAEAGALLEDIYWAIADVATPNSGDTTHLSTAGQIYSYIDGLNYVANAWDNLNDMPLNDGLIYIGDASNNPAAQTMSGHATITNAGVVTVSATSGLSGENITTGTVADARIAASIARDSEITYKQESDLTAVLDDDYRAESWDNFTGIPTATPTDGDLTHLSSSDQIRDYVVGLGYSTTTGTVTSIATTAPITGGTITSTGTISLTACSDQEFYVYNSTSAAWYCEGVGTSGLQHIVEDTNATLGSDLDMNGYKITDAAGTADMTINASGIIFSI